MKKIVDFPKAEANDNGERIVTATDYYLCRSDINGEQIHKEQFDGSEYITTLARYVVMNFGLILLIFAKSLLLVTLNFTAHRCIAVNVHNQQMEVIKMSNQRETAEAQRERRKAVQEHLNKLGNPQPPAGTKIDDFIAGFYHMDTKEPKIEKED